MRSKRFERNGASAYVVVFDQGDEAAAGLREFARRHGIAAASITGVGGFERVTVGFFEWETKRYREIPVEEQVEVLSFDGDIALKEEEPEPHVHVVLGRADGTTVGGHLMHGAVRPTLEIVVEEAPDVLRRRHDPASGLALIDLS